MKIALIENVSEELNKGGIKMPEQEELKIANEKYDEIINDKDSYEEFLNKLGIIRFL